MDTIKAVQRSIDFMEDHLCEHMEQEQIAEAGYMSLPNLYRIFYALTGHPLMEYIRKRRINQAAIRLRNHDSPILDIALDCGFDSYRTFATVFKKNTGMTPGVYRKSEVYFSFERIHLQERVRYSEDMEMSRQYSDVKVIRVPSMQAIAYRHASPSREGLEEEAFALFYEMLSTAGFKMGKARIFGYDDPESGKHEGLHRYMMIAPLDDRLNLDLDLSKVTVIMLPGGLYAESKVLAGKSSSIIAAWNRILAEWLPRSNFMLGDHPFMEEYQHHGGKVNRLKLLLPVRRQNEQATIGVVDLAPVRTLSYRSVGVNCRAAVDNRITQWLTDLGMAGQSSRSLFMSYSYGMVDGDDSWYELALTIEDDDPLTAEHRGFLKELDGGLYACMTNHAYGVMTGVLDMLHEWLSRNMEYRIDDGRSWFAQYCAGDLTESDNVERSARVTCYIPVIPVGE
jgi:AraC family transcriptional regulator